MKSAPALPPGNYPTGTTPIRSTTARNFQISPEHGSPSNPASSAGSAQMWGPVPNMASFLVRTYEAVLAA